MVEPPCTNRDAELPGRLEGKFCTVWTGVPVGGMRGRPTDPPGVGGSGLTALVDPLLARLARRGGCWGC